MPLGQPSISTPRALQLQAIQQSIDNIRERFSAAEAAVSALQTSTGAAAQASVAGLAVLRRQLTQLDARVTALEQAASGGGGALEVLQTTDALDIGSPVWLSADGTVSALDPDDPLAAAGFYGLSTQVGAVGDDVQIRRSGILEIPGAAFTPGRQLYAAVDGVTHEPVGNALPVGIAASTTAVSVTPGTLALVIPGMYGMGDDYLPVSYALFRSAVGAGGVLPVVTGEVPPVLLYLDDGSLVYSGVE